MLRLTVNDAEPVQERRLFWYGSNNLGQGIEIAGDDGGARVLVRRLRIVKASPRRRISTMTALKLYLRQSSASFLGRWALKNPGPKESTQRPRNSDAGETSVQAQQ